MVEKLREALELIRAMLSQHSGSQSSLGDAFKVADAALQPQDVPTNGDAGTGARADDKLTDDLNDILQPFHWEAWNAALFSDHTDGWHRSEARSEGKAWASTGRSRWTAYH